MKSLETWFSEYSVSHQNPLNQKIHLVCVPAIYLSLLGLLWCIPQTTIAFIEVSWALVAVGLITIFYLFLDSKLAMIMLVFSLVFTSIFEMMTEAGLPLLQISLAVFVLAWIGQAYGHKVEGKKPSFFADLTYLLIGPLWVVHKLIRGKS